MSDTIATSIQVGISELLDKFSILKIKHNRMKCTKQLLEVENEISVLEDKVIHYLNLHKDLSIIFEELLQVNNVLWCVESSIRIKDSHNEFDNTFINLAKAVYKNNEKRFKLKSRINLICNSQINEQKDYYVDSLSRKTMYIFGHQGLGDMLIINGLVRYFAERNNIVLWVRNNIYENVFYMFRDLTNIEYIRCDDYWQSRKHFTESHNTSLLCLGDFGEHAKEYVPYVHFVKLFYRDAKIDYNVMRSHFMVLRDRDTEDALYRNVLSYLNTDVYIVIHDDPSRGFTFDKSTIPEIVDEPNIPIFYIGKDRCDIQGKTIFDYITILEKCKAYHGFDSSIEWMIDLLDINIPVKYLHTHCKANKPDFVKEYYKSMWVCI